jgi:hypothetical protein
MDLTSALLGLERASSLKRQSRRALMEATQLIAEEIVDRVRAGNSVQIHTDDIVTYEVARVVWQTRVGPHPSGTTALLRGDAVLSDLAGGEPADLRPSGSLVGRHPGREELLRWKKNLEIVDWDDMGVTPYDLYDLHLATDDERFAFAGESELVIDTFTEYLTERAGEEQARARSITKLRSR